MGDLEHQGLGLNEGLGLAERPFFCMSGGWGGGFGVSFSLPSGSSSSLPIVSIVVPFVGLTSFG